MAYIRNAFAYLTDTAARIPQKLAFADEKQAYTFAMLEEATSALGTYLVKESAQTAPVVILCDRTALSLVGMLGALAAGMPYVPLDVRMPRERLGVVLDTVKPMAVLVAEADRARVAWIAESYPIAVLEDCVAIQPDRSFLAERRARVLDMDPVYIIFTSGSTGVPKGIAISHRALIDFTEWMAEDCGVTEDDILANQAPFYFDLSVKDIYQTLKCGCTTHILPKKCFLFPMLLVDALNEKRVTTLIWATSAFRLAADSGVFTKKVPETVRRVILGGEALLAKHVNLWKAAIPSLEVINLYGPTEVTVDCTAYHLDRDFADGEPIPIGTACANMDVVLLDDDLRPVPDGDVGEICVRGIGLAAGYYDDPAKTASAFVQNPLQPHYPERLYRTGDLARRGDDGLLYFLARRDDQIKHMGYRIELGEIETALSDVPAIRAAICFFDAAADKIVCCAVLDGDLGAITSALKTRLPAYMLPNVWRQYDRLPLNANGKIDRVVLKQQYLAEKQHESD